MPNARVLAERLESAARKMPAVAVESKSSPKVASDQFDHLAALGDRAESELAAYESQRRIVYGGDHAETRYGVGLVPWHSVQGLRW